MSRPPAAQSGQLRDLRTGATSLTRTLAALLTLLAPACSDDAPAGVAPLATQAIAQQTDADRPGSVEQPLAPEDAALLGQAVAAMKARRYEQVAPLLAPLLARDPPPAEAQFVAGSAAYELNDYGQAAARLADAVSRSPDFLPGAVSLGFAQFKLGDFDAARDSFARIVAVRDDAYKAHYGLGLLAVSEGRLAEAREHLERALELQPDYLKARFQLARLLQEEQRLDEACAELQRVLDAWPDHEEALYRLAQVLNSLGRGEEAAAMAARHAAVYKLREATGGLLQRVRSGDDSPERRAEIVRLYVELGDDEQASAAVADALQRFPADAGLLALREQLTTASRER